MKDQQQVIHRRHTENTKRIQYVIKLRLCWRMSVPVPVCLCTDHGELVGRGPVLKQQVDDVGVALLSGLV